MEKRSPHWQLSVIKTLIEEGKVYSTFSALAGGAALGFDFNEMVSVVASLTLKDSTSPMTTHSDYRVWQDVYRPTTAAGEVYLKLTRHSTMC